MGYYLSTRDTQKGTQTKHGRRCLRYVYVGANKILIGIYIGSVGVLPPTPSATLWLLTMYYLLHIIYSILYTQQSAQKLWGTHLIEGS